MYYFSIAWMYSQPPDSLYGHSQIIAKFPNVKIGAIGCNWGKEIGVNVACRGCWTMGLKVRLMDQDPLIVS